MNRNTKLTSARVACDFVPRPRGSKPTSKQLFVDIDYFILSSQFLIIVSV